MFKGIDIRRKNKEADEPTVGKNNKSGPSDSEGFLCPICMEALKSAEVLQVHWQEVHDVKRGASAAGNTFYSGTSVKFPLINDKELGLKKDSSKSCPYIPQLPVEGSENELESYRALAQDMIILINDEREVTGSLKSQITRLEDVLQNREDQIRKELIVMKQMFEQSENDRDSMSIEILRLSNENSRLIKENDSLQNNVERVSQKAGNLAMTNANLQSRLDEAQSKIQTLQDDIISVQSKLNKQEVCNEKLAMQLQQRPEADGIKAMQTIQSQMIQLHDPIKGDDLQLSQMFEEVLTRQQDPPSDDKLTQEPDIEVDRVDLKLAQVSLSSMDRPLSIIQHTEIPQQESSSDHQAKHITNQRDTGSILWFSGTVELISPSVEQCEEVMRQLKQTREQWKITLHSTSRNSLLILFSNINECLVWRLEIHNTSLDSNSIADLSNALISFNNTIEELELWKSSFPPNSLWMIVNALSLNTTLKTLVLRGDKNITDEDVPHICRILTSNKTLKRLYLNSCPNITNFGEQKISKVLHNNTTLSYLCINGKYFRR